MKRALTPIADNKKGPRDAGLLFLTLMISMRA
jgi:hypothetical protein